MARMSCAGDRLYRNVARKALAHVGVSMPSLMSPVMLLYLSAEEAETLYPLTKQQHAKHEHQDGRHRLIVDR